MRMRDDKVHGPMSFQLDQPTGLPCYYRHDSVAVPHGFFSAEGGVSTGLYHSLNCGFGSADDPVMVQENRARAAQSLGLSSTQLAAVYQVHGTMCEVVSEATPTDRDALVRADGLVSCTPGVGLTILTADCLPVLLADTTAGVIGACHAGWRGACGGITSSTIDAMRSLGASSITALIGPTIRQASYQVGAEMRDAVIATSDTAMPAADIAACFVPDEDDGTTTKYRFDLAAYVRARLTLDGIEAIHDCGLDTYRGNGADVTDGESPAFFSHRRATHAAVADSGRQISMIAL